MTDFGRRAPFGVQGGISSSDQGAMVGCTNVMPKACERNLGMVVIYTGPPIPGTDPDEHVFICRKYGENDYGWDAFRLSPGGGGQGSIVAWRQLVFEGPSIARMTIDGQTQHVQIGLYVKDPGADPTTRQPYHFAYNLSHAVPDANWMDIPVDYLTLNGLNTHIEDVIRIKAADTLANKAGLYTKALADKKLNLPDCPGGTCAVPYDIRDPIAMKDTVRLGYELITLDNKDKVSHKEITLDAADIANDKAGLYTKQLADVKVNVSDIRLSENTETTARKAARSIMIDGNTWWRIENDIPPFPDALLRSGGVMYGDIEMGLYPGTQSHAQIHLHDDSIQNPTSAVNRKYVDTGLTSKVDKIEGMGLSHNDFTNGYRNKLNNVAFEATNTIVSGNPVDGDFARSITVRDGHDMTLRWNLPSVSVSHTGTATVTANFITLNGQEYKIGGSGKEGTKVEWQGLLAQGKPIGRLILDGQVNMLFCDEGGVKGDFLPRDGSKMMEGHLNMGGQRIVNMGVPFAETDAATKQYVDENAGKFIEDLGVEEVSKEPYKLPYHFTVDKKEDRIELTLKTIGLERKAEDRFLKDYFYALPAADLGENKAGLYTKDFADAKLDVLGNVPGNDGEPSNEPHRVPYKMVLNRGAAAIGMTYSTVSLDNKKNYTDISYSIPAADVAGNLSGLYTKALSDLKEAVANKANDFIDSTEPGKGTIDSTHYPTTAAVDKRIQEYIKGGAEYIGAVSKAEFEDIIKTGKKGTHTLVMGDFLSITEELDYKGKHYTAGQFFITSAINPVSFTPIGMFDLDEYQKREVDKTKGGHILSLNKQGVIQASALTEGGLMTWEKRVTKIDSSSTDDQWPTAKAVFNHTAGLSARIDEAYSKADDAQSTADSARRATRRHSIEIGVMAGNILALDGTCVYLMANKATKTALASAVSGLELQLQNLATAVFDEIDPTTPVSRIIKLEDNMRDVLDDIPKKLSKDGSDTMDGPLVFSDPTNQHARILSSNPNTSITITHTGQNGAFLILGSHTQSGGNGSFGIGARQGRSSCLLQGYPDGRLMWNGKELATGDGKYLPLVGGTMTGPIKFKYVEDPQKQNPIPSIAFEDDKFPLEIHAGKFMGSNIMLYPAKGENPGEAFINCACKDAQGNPKVSQFNFAPYGWVTIEDYDGNLRYMTSWEESGEATPNMIVSSAESNGRIKITECSAEKLNFLKNVDHDIKESLDGKLNKAGDTMTGLLTMKNNTIQFDDATGHVGTIGIGTGTVADNTIRLGTQAGSELTLKQRELSALVIGEQGISKFKFDTKGLSINSYSVPTWNKTLPTVPEAGRAVITTENGRIKVSETTADEIKFLHGVTSKVQEQLDRRLRCDREDGKPDEADMRIPLIMNGHEIIGGKAGISSTQLTLKGDSTGAGASITLMGSDSRGTIAISSIAEGQSSVLSMMAGERPMYNGHRLLTEQEIANTLDVAAEGKALDARQGRTLSETISQRIIRASILPSTGAPGQIFENEQDGSVYRYDKKDGWVPFGFSGSDVYLRTDGGNRMKGNIAYEGIRDWVLSGGSTGASAILCACTADRTKGAMLTLNGSGKDGGRFELLNATYGIYGEADKLQWVRKGSFGQRERRYAVAIWDSAELPTGNTARPLEVDKDGRLTVVDGGYVKRSGDTMTGPLKLTPNAMLCGDGGDLRIKYAENSDITMHLVKNSRGTGELQLNADLRMPQGKSIGLYNSTARLELTNERTFLYESNGAHFTFERDCNILFVSGTVKGWFLNSNHTVNNLESNDPQNPLSAAMGKQLTKVCMLVDAPTANAAVKFTGNVELASNKGSGPTLIGRTDGTLTWNNKPLPQWKKSTITSDQVVLTSGTAGEIKTASMIEAFEMMLDEIERDPDRYANIIRRLRTIVMASEGTQK